MSDKTGIWIPIEIMQLTGISSTCKILLAEIVILSELARGCDQTDKGFAADFGISEYVVSKAIKTLSDKGYITKRTESADKGSRRAITPTAKITIPPTAKITIPPTAKTPIPPSQNLYTPTAESSTHIRNRKTKNKNNTNTITNTTLPAVGNEPTLYKSIEASFLSKTGKFTNYPKEGKAIKGLIAKAENWAPDNPAEFIRDMITRYYELRQSDKFIGKQPFTPSALNSGWLFDRVMIPLESANDDIDPELDFLFKETPNEPGNVRSLG